MKEMTLAPDRYFDPDPRQKEIALSLYGQVAGLPLICPHGHVDPRMFSDPDYSFGSPADLLIVPDHYVFRMLYSQGVSLESLGVPRRDGGAVERDHRKIWQTFADHFYLFRGTPTGIWLRDELVSIFGVQEALTGESAQRIYDQIEACLRSPEFRPRALYERFKIEVMSTTDAATDTLEQHQAIRSSGWSARIVPTFRPDAVVNLDAPTWRSQIDKLSEVSGTEINGYRAYVKALEERRRFFKTMGATATDHAAQSAFTSTLSEAEAENLFSRALRGQANRDDAARFTGHMMIEFARMSVQDGLVMQFHTGSCRNHNPAVFAAFGPDKGADIPVQGEFTQGLKPLLDRFGSDPRLTLVLFNLDEATYARELAPLAGHYPALRIGPPWWFYDSLNGMRRYFDLIVETAGLYNTVGFNDDTRAFPSIPARHDLWRRAAANWIAGLVVRHVVEMSDAEAMVRAAAYDLAKKGYRL